MDLIDKYNRQVPRYTSYPTAPHFSESVDEGCYTQWLSALTGDEGVSLYLHIPFCYRLCWFCGCHKKIVTRYDPVVQYVDLLTREIALVAGQLPKRMTVRHIHFGGGSPSILEPEDFLRIMETLHSHFAVDPDAEIAMEIEPRTAALASIEAFARGGINRVSLGIQDFTPKVQEAINRVQTFEETQQVLERFYDYGIRNANFDLIYGLPYQTVEGIVSTVDQVLQLNASRVALFGYAHVPWMKNHQKLVEEEALPDAQARFSLYTAAADRFFEAGFLQIGLDHFSTTDDRMGQAHSEGSLHRNFQGYTTDQATVMIGLGASAIGRLSQGYAQNSPDLKEYCRRIESSGLPIIRGVAFSDDDRLRGEVIERLMCYLEVDLKALCAEYGVVAVDYFAEALSLLEPLRDDGLVTVEEGVVRVASETRFLVRIVCSVFDRYFAPQQSLHSQSV